jgi:hypothetical protein
MTLKADTASLPGSRFAFQDVGKKMTAPRRKVNELEQVSDLCLRPNNPWKRPGD